MIQLEVLITLGAILLLFFDKIAGTIWSALVLMIALAFIVLLSGYGFGAPNEDTKRTTALNAIVCSLGFALLVSSTLHIKLYYVNLRSASSRCGGLGAQIVLQAQSSFCKNSG